MSEHFIDGGAQAEYTPATDTPAGSICPVVAGKIYGINHLPIKAGETGVVDLVGRFELLKAQVALSRGDAAYVGSDGTVTTSTDGTYKIGVASDDAASAGTTARIYFHGIVG
ncbi:MAG: DUF2190 family protein [Opitutales bacterium]|nr:DUF2190 family protein [Opitutales bacterium]